MIDRRADGQSRETVGMRVACMHGWMDGWMESDHTKAVLMIVCVLGVGVVSAI